VLVVGGEVEVVVDPEKITTREVETTSDDDAASTALILSTEAPLDHA
jgi:hypothetical protein